LEEIKEEGGDACPAADGGCGDAKVGEHGGEVGRCRGVGDGFGETT